MVMLSATLAAGLLFTNIYTSIVDAPNWGHNIPASLEVTRSYFSAANPGIFFRIVSPLGQVVTLFAVILCWTVDKRIRYFLLAALVIAIAADGLTFAYFYPRNDIMFVKSLVGSTEALRDAWSQWSSMNWVRSALVAIGLVFDFAALNRLPK